MKLKQTVNLLLIALFLLAYQSSTIHSSQHALKADNDCHVCVSSGKFEENLHVSTFPTIIETHSLESVNVQQRVVVKKRLDMVQKPLPKRADFSGMRHFCVQPIPLGYLSTAPPTIFS